MHAFCKKRASVTDEEPLGPAIEQWEQAATHDDGIVLERRLPDVPLERDAAQERDASDGEIAREDVTVWKQCRH